MKTILIVDDQKSARHGLKAFLSHIPEFEVVGEATNGQEAIAWLATNLPDIVLMDVKMPTMDGFTATRYIKKLGLPVKVILISMVVSSKAEAMAAGADDFISKNEPPERMLSMLRALDFEASETSINSSIQRDSS